MTENFQRNKAVIKIFVNTCICFENYVAFHCNTAILLLKSFLDSVSRNPIYCQWYAKLNNTPT